MTTTMTVASSVRFDAQAFLRQPILGKMPVQTAFDIKLGLGNELFAKMVKMLGFVQVPDWPDDLNAANQMARLRRQHKRYDAHGNARTLMLFAEEYSPVQCAGAWFCLNARSFLQMYRTPVGWEVLMSPDVAMLEGHLKEAEALELFDAYRQVFGR